MEQLLGAYHSDSDSEDELKRQEPVAPAPPGSAAAVASKAAASRKLGRLGRMQAAPDVAGVSLDDAGAAHVVDPRVSTVFYNPTVEQLWAPVAGPRAKGATSALDGYQNAVTGFVEQASVDEVLFHQRLLNFDRRSGPPADAQEDQELMSVHAQSVESERRREARDELRRKRRTEGLDDAGDLARFQGPWAAARDPNMPEPGAGGEQELTQEQKDYIRAREEAKQQRKKRRLAEGGGGGGEDGMDEDTGAPESSEWLAAVDQLDYQGRSFVERPPGLAPPAEPLKATCRLPKKLVHTYRGHEKAVASIQLFPGVGHLLLSASMDGTARIWSTRDSGEHKRRPLRTYNGHAGPLRMADFLHDGTRFLTASHDRWIKIWDTETGKVVSRHTSKAVPLCAKFHPTPSESYGVLAGQDNRRVVQWDTRANEIVQIYDEHLKGVNSITFIDQNRKFVSSSDDLKLLVWEYGIPVVVKHISDPHMHSMPAITMHPSGKYFAGQSLDNNILVYKTEPKIRMERNKYFKGHQNSSFAIQPGFSSNGEFVMSGDGSGKLFFWDWRRRNILAKLQAHDSVCISSLWHPLEQSTVFSAGWDGLIKVWK